MPVTDADIATTVALHQAVINDARTDLAVAARREKRVTHLFADINTALNKAAKELSTPTLKAHWHDGMRPVANPNTALRDICKQLYKLNEKLRAPWGTIPAIWGPRQVSGQHKLALEMIDAAIDEITGLLEGTSDVNLTENVRQSNRIVAEHISCMLAAGNLLGHVCQTVGVTRKDLAILCTLLRDDRGTCEATTATRMLSEHAH